MELFVREMMLVALGLAIILFGFRQRKPTQQPVPTPESEPTCKPVKVYLMKIGGFVDEMASVAARFKSSGTLYDQWYDSISPDSWTRTRGMQLDEKWIQAFVDDMTNLFQKAITAATNCDLHNTLSSEGHKFMQNIKVRCLTLGLDVSDINFESSFSFGDVVMRAQG